MWIPAWGVAASLAAQGCGVWSGLGLPAIEALGAGGAWVNAACRSATSRVMATQHNQHILQPRQASGAASQFSPLLPPAIPLAVRSPYLSAWLATGSEGGGGGYLPGRWAQFWPIQYPDTPDQHRLEWAGIIRVDGKAYEFMGLPSQSVPGGLPQAKQIAFAYTSTRSIFTLEAGGVQFVVTFLSPISPGDSLRQCLPFSYLTITIVRATDGHPHKVEVYTDISSDWASGDKSVDIVSRSKSLDGGKAAMSLKWWELGRKDQLVFSEVNEYAEWGNAVYATAERPGLTCESGPDNVTRSAFASSGLLNDKVDEQPQTRPEGNRVFAFAAPLDVPASGQDPTTTHSVNFVIGHVRDPYVNFVTTTGQLPYSPYWLSTFPDYIEAMSFFIADYDTALAKSIELDGTIQADSVAAGGPEYAAITSLSARQAMGTFEIVIGKDAKGRWDHNDVMAFSKEISSNGDMSTVDVIFPAFPILTYLDPTLLQYLLNPIFRYSESGLYPNKWTVHDLGTYPNATGHNDGNDEPMPVEEAGNMIIMALTYYQMSEDKAFIQKHYTIMQQWADFLITDGLIPDEQLSTDDFAGKLANQTNLALKAIIGIGAISEIAAACGDSKASTSYGDTAKQYIAQWEKLAVSADGTHTKLAYQDDQSSWGTLYNLYADRILNLNLVPQRIYDMQTKFYPTVANFYGLPLDHRHTWVKSDWLVWAAGTMTSISSRDLLVEFLGRYLRANIVNAAFPDLYESESADFPGRSPTSTWRIEFINRPVVGGHFALVALEKANVVNKVSRKPFI